MTEAVPAIDAVQMAEVDRVMIADYRIALLQMMENAGRHLADLARRRFLAGDPRARRVAILAGTGGNGGGALACARHLHNYGASVHVLLTKPGEQFTPTAKHQLDILHRMQIPTTLAENPPAAPDLIVDGLIGYSLKGAPHGNAAALIRWANAQSAPILALDLPSGLDPTTGTAYDPAIRAAATLTLALPKKGLLAPGTQAYTGELYLADISVPPTLYARLGLQVGHLFAKASILRLA